MARQRRSQPGKYRISRLARIALTLEGGTNPIADLDVAGSAPMRAYDADESAAFAMPGAEKNLTRPGPRRKSRIPHPRR